jgi:hypothetical protein
MHQNLFNAFLLGLKKITQIFQEMLVQATFDQQNINILWIDF